MIFVPCICFAALPTCVAPCWSCRGNAQRLQLSPTRGKSRGRVGEGAAGAVAASASASASASAGANTEHAGPVPALFLQLATLGHLLLVHDLEVPDGSEEGGVELLGLRQVPPCTSCPGPEGQPLHKLIGVVLLLLQVRPVLGHRHPS